MYRVHLSVALSARNGTIGLSRWLRLPFAPYRGLDLLGVTSEPEWPEVITSVAWDVAENCFHAELGDFSSRRETVAMLLDYFGPGWEIHEPGTAPVADTS